MSQYDEETLRLLERSLRQLGQVYSVIVDTDGEVLAGRHRLKAGASKKTVVDTQKIAERLGVSRKMAKLMLILHTNVQRRISKEETREIILNMAKELEAQGVPREKIASELYKKYVPYSERYIRELLPDEYKMGSKARAKQKFAELVPQNEVQDKEPRTLKIDKPATLDQINRIMELYSKVYGGEPSDEFLQSLDYNVAKIIIEDLEESIEKHVPEKITDEQFRKIVELKEKLLGRPLRDVDKQYLRTLTKSEAEGLIRELEIQLRTFKPPRTEREIQQQIHSPVSRMDIAIPMRLNQMGVTGFVTQQPICVYQLIPDIMFPDKRIMIFLDGPGHKHDDLEFMMREAMTRRGWTVIELEYERYSKQEVERIVQEILEILGREVEVKR